LLETNRLDYSTECHAKLAFSSPNHTTTTARPSAVERQSEHIGDSDGRWHLYARAEVRQIDNGAVEEMRVVIQNDIGALNGARARNPSIILHRRLLYFQLQNAFDLITLLLKGKEFCRTNYNGSLRTGAASFVVGAGPSRTCAQLAECYKLSVNTET
jgi:hypothetical protein